MARFVLQGGGRYGFHAGGAALQAHSLVTLQVEQACLSIARKGLEEFVQEAHQRFAAATGLRRGDELAAGDVDKQADVIAQAIERAPQQVRVGPYPLGLGRTKRCLQ